MAETTIEWTRGPLGELGYTFNGWIGCEKISPGCDNCYAATQDKFRGWTPEGWGGPRRRTGDENWKKPKRWNEAAAAACERRRVFCSSLADVFDNKVPPEWRAELFSLIADTPHLDWLLLTKRIGNAAAMIAEAQGDRAPISKWAAWPLPNVWLGATVVNQEEADRDIPKLLATPARVRFLSMEPLLGPVDLRVPLQLGRCTGRGPAPARFRCGLTVDHGDEHSALTETGAPWFGKPMLDWVIVGGESGHGARPMHPDWARSLRDPRAAAGAEQFGQYGVNGWDESMGAVIGVKSPGQGSFSVADPRVNWNAGAHEAKLRVTAWKEPHAAVTGARGPYSGACAVADPRHNGPAKHSNEFRIVRWDAAAQAVTSAHGSGQAVADPRDRNGFAKYAVTPFDAPAGTVISGSTTGQGAFAVADPRAIGRGKGDHYLTGGHYGVTRWDDPSFAVSASACHDNGRWSVADPRPMPAPSDKLVAIIRALDGTWHRPFTTLELAALQSLLDPEASWVPWKLHGESDQAHRERIGNAVPRHAARAIAEVMGETLLLAWSGETFMLSARPVWVRPLQIALSVQGA